MILGRLLFTWLYLRHPPWDSGISPPELMDYIETHPPGRAIDLGCGTGTNVITLVRNGWTVTGVDFIPRAIRMAKQKIQKENIRADLHVADVTNLRGIEGPFDLALDIGCFHGVNHKDAYLAELSRILASGGHWLVYGFIQSGSSLTGGITMEDLQQTRDRGFSLLWRTDGIEKRERPCAWMLWKKNLQVHL